MPFDQTDDAGNALRGQFQDLVAGMLPLGDVFETVLRRRAKQRKVRTAATSALVVAIAGAGVPLTLGSSGQASGTNLRVASFILKLPHRYQSVASTATACDPLAAVAYPLSASGDPGGSSSSPPDESAIATAATADGGCVSMLLTAPYAPGSADAPKALIDQATESAVKVGSYDATVGTGSQISGVAPPGFRSPPAGQIVLDVSVPAGSGESQDLIIAAMGLTPNELVSIVSQGLQQAG